MWRYGRSTALVQVVVMGGGLVVARLLGPADYGLWTALLLVPAYAKYLQLGTLSVLNRELPIARGRGDLKRAEKIQNTALGVVCFVAVLSGGGLLGYAVVWRGRYEPAVLGSLTMLAGIVAIQPFLHYYDVLFRSGHDFTTVGRLRLLKTFTDIPLAMALAGWWGVVGRAAASLASSVSQLGYSVRRRADVRPAWDAATVRQLVGMGFPLLAVDASYGILISLDRLLIASFLDRTQLGYYGIGLMGLGLFMLIPGTVSEVLYPRMAERFGATDSIRAMRTLVVAPLSVLGTGMAVLVGGGMILVRPVVDAVLPDYLPGVEAATIALIGGLFLSLVPGAGNFLLTLNKQTPLLAIYGTTGVAMAVLLIVLARNGYGIVGIAAATVACYAATAAVVVGYVLRHFYGVGESVVRVLWLLLPGTLIVAGAATLERSWPFVGSPSGAAAAQLLLKLTLFGAWSGLIAWTVFRRGPDEGIGAILARRNGADA
jgi:O-antigen/teichoic acid export membrane protein